MSNYLTKLLKKQQEAVEGRDTNICGEIVKIGALDAEEKDQMVQDGIEYGNQLVTINGIEKKIIDIDNGQMVVAVMNTGLNSKGAPLEGEGYQMWYPWRGKKIIKEWEKLNSQSQEAIKPILEKNGLWTYLEEWL